MMKMRVVGGPGVQARLNKLSAAASGQALRSAAIAAGLPIQRTWKELFRSPGDPSIAGEPPRRRTGQYSRSIQVVPTVTEERRAVVEVGTNITDPPYPFFLEYGTSKMPAHPIARPAFEQSKGEAAAEGKRELSAQLGRL